jgi:hypothetical protein
LAALNKNNVRDCSMTRQLSVLNEHVRETVAKQMRAKHYITHSQMLSIIAWKHSRGKYRPGNYSGAENRNDAEHVKTHSASILARVRSTQNKHDVDEDCAIIKAFAAGLKYVGVATASLMLALYAPDRFAFFADEAAWCTVNPGTKLVYNLKFVGVFTEAMQRKARTLNEAAAKAHKKNKNTQQQQQPLLLPQDVSDALWSAAAAVATPKPASKKRKTAPAAAAAKRPKKTKTK